MGSSILAISETGDPIRQFTQEYSSKDRQDFMKLFRSSRYMEPLKSQGTSRRSWNYASLPDLNVFWDMPNTAFHTGIKEAALLSDGFWDDFILVDPDESHCTKFVNMGLTLPTLKKWDILAKLWIFKRTAEEKEMLPASSREAQANLNSINLLIKTLYPLLPEKLHSLLPHWSMTAQKLAGLIATIDEPLKKEITEHSARKAMQLTKWLLSRTIKIRLDTMNQTEVEADTLKEETMLRKIAQKQPVKRRDLYRSFKRQSASEHDPVLESLRVKGRVRMDENQFLLLNS